MLEILYSFSSHVRTDLEMEEGYTCRFVLRVNGLEVS
jgi:hypothetical protein